MEQTIKIIEEALMDSMEKTPETFIDKIFHKSPSMSRIKSSAIKYLTDKFINERELRKKSEKSTDEIFYAALKIIGTYDPEQQMKFHQKFNPHH